MIIKDPQTQANALAAGEIDIIEAPAHELYNALKANPDIQIVEAESARLAGHPALQSPAAALRQSQGAASGDGRAQPAGVPAKRRSACPSCIAPASPSIRATPPTRPSKGMDFIAKPDMKRAQQLLKESGYDGTPVVIMQPTDLVVDRQAAGGRDTAAAAGRLQGRHAVDGLADAGVAAREEGPAGARRLEHLPHRMGHRWTAPTQSA